jgi:hypothetical protein
MQLTLRSEQPQTPQRKKKKASQFLVGVLSHNDIIPSDAQTTKRKKRRADGAPTNTVVVANTAQPHRKDIIRDKFNISNDQAYQITRERHRVRQTFGQLLVQHAYPAVKLQLPWVR